MPLTKEQEMEQKFSFLTRHLDPSTLAKQIEAAKQSHLPEYALIRDIAMAAKLFPERLQTQFGISGSQIEECIQITNHHEPDLPQDTSHATLFGQRKSALYGKDQSDQLFKSLSQDKPGKTFKG